MSKTRWVDGSYVNKQGRKINWIIPEGGDRNQGVSPSVALRVVDSDLDSLRTVALAMTNAAAAASDAVFWVAIKNTVGTFETLTDRQRNTSEILIIMQTTEVQVYHNNMWVSPDAAGIKAMVPPPPPAPPAAPPAPPAAPSVATTSDVAKSGPPAGPAVTNGKLLDRVMAAQGKK
jgi:hypothetical protein